MPETPMLLTHHTKKTIQKLAYHLGYDIRQRPRLSESERRYQEESSGGLTQEQIDAHFRDPGPSILSPGMPYQYSRPAAMLSPWNTDSKFVEIANQVYHPRADLYERFSLSTKFYESPLLTYVDKFRMYELWLFVEQVCRLKEGAFIEVGVWRGGSAYVMATQMKHRGISEPFYLCDTFCGVVNSGEKDPHYEDGQHADTSPSLVETYAAEFGLTNLKLLQGIFPSETAAQIPAETRFRFCHIDVDVYQSAKDTLDWVWPRLVHGGVVVFDDYGFMGCDGVTKLVHEERGKKDCLFIHNLNGHAIFVKI